MPCRPWQPTPDPIPTQRTEHHVWLHPHAHRHDLRGRPRQDITALKAEGFGVLSDIDVQHAMKEKLAIDMPPHRILGACNPSLANRALQAVPDIGLLLPCNVIVREEAPERVVIGFLDPQIMVKLVGKPEVTAVADAVEERLRRACESLGGSTPQSP